MSWVLKIFFLYEGGYLTMKILVGLEKVYDTPLNVIAKIVSHQSLSFHPGSSFNLL